MASAATAHAQNAGGRSLAVSASSNSVAVLPDDPSVAISYTAYDPGTPAITRQQVRQERTASLHMKYIPPGWKVLPLAPHDKVLLGFKDLYNPYTVGTIVISAGYSHLTNGRPNFGTDGGAFAERFGAAFWHNEHSVRVVESLEREGAGLNLTDVAGRRDVAHRAWRAWSTRRPPTAKQAAPSRGSGCCPSRNPSACSPRR